MKIKTLIDDLNKIADICEGATGGYSQLFQTFRDIRDRCKDRIKEYDLERAAAPIPEEL